MPVTPFGSSSLPCGSFSGFIPIFSSPVALLNASLPIVVRLLGSVTFFRFG